MKRNKDILEESTLFEQRYGNNFTAFFYRQNLDNFIRTEVLSFRNPSSNYNTFLDNSYWDIKHPFNFPGPFYTGESDTCGTGDIEAPNNVLYDKNTCEFIFKQPISFAEFLGVIDAAAVEVLDSYSCDGNSFWTYKKCKEWWSCRFDIINEMSTRETIEVNGERVNLFINYLETEAENDLKMYCYFLEQGCYPKKDVTILPSLN